MAAVPFFRRLVRLSICATILLTSCGGGTKTPTQPTPAAPGPAPVTVTDIRIGTAGNASTTLAPGDRLQLFAQAVNSDGTVNDVTNLAVWQSSNPLVATVSAGGVLTAAAEGALDVSASYSSKSGSLHAEVQKPGCAVTLSPDSIVFGALASSATVTVTTTLSNCRWKARSDASWLSFQLDPNRSGNGTFTYSVPGNNNTDARDANIVVTVDGGPASLHRIHQERPVGCVYSVTPVSLSFSPAGGSGSCTVTTIPGDCQWRINDSIFELSSLGPTSGTGSATVRYTVAAGSFSSTHDHTISIQGLSGLNPPGVHTIHLVAQ